MRGKSARRLLAELVIWSVLGVLAPTGLTAQLALAQDRDALKDLQLLRVRTEDWCSRYDRQDYAYPRTLERRIIRSQGGLYSPYDLTCFQDPRESDIEHIVALAEAHRSGMCSRSGGEKVQFATDLLNLTLATPRLNREQKVAKDADEWLPPENKCWYAGRVVAVKKKYRLTVDRAELRALRKVLRGCESSEVRRPRCD